MIEKKIVFTFFFLVTLVSLFLPKPVSAALSCTASSLCGSGVCALNNLPFSTVNENVQTSFWVNKATTDEILNRYIYYGNGWVAWIPSSGSTNGLGLDYDRIIPMISGSNFPQTQNYAIGTAWVYKDSAGQVRSTTCGNVWSTCLKVFNADIKSYGTVNLTPSSGNVTKTVSGNHAYVGLITMNGPNWTGNNNGHFNQITNYWYFGDARTYGTFWGNWDFATSEGSRPVAFWNTGSTLNANENVVLRPATFSDGGAGASSTYNLDNLLIYSRNLSSTTCGSLPAFFVTTNGQYFGKPQCEARVDIRKGWCLLNPALGQINPSNPSDPINTWKWSYFSVGGSPVTQTPTAAPTRIPTIPPNPTVTPTPGTPRLNCQGQYFGKPQCDARATATYGSGGTCKLNPALGTINPNNPNDPVNYWKWSYCK